MEKEEQLFRKRIQELAENAYSRDIPLHTDFLTLAEQTVFQNMSATLPPVKFVLSGGFPMSERKVLCFLASYEEELYAPPFVCLKIVPANRRFAEKLTHRDYLGAIMNLGIERAMIGDIVLQDGNAWAFVMEKMSRYLAENLTMIRHTSVVTEITADFSELPEPEMEEISGTVSSVRLDSVIALCGRLSRDEGSIIYRRREGLCQRGCLPNVVAEIFGAERSYRSAASANSGLASQEILRKRGGHLSWCTAINRRLAL